MEPVFKTKLESTEEYEKFEKLIRRQILDFSNYHLVVHVKVSGGDDLEEHFASYVFHPTGSESFQFMDYTIHTLVYEKCQLEVTVNNIVSQEQ